LAYALRSAAGQKFFVFKMKNARVELKAWNVFVPSPSSNKVFSTIAQS
jgi:hypothetical protein